MAQEGLAGLANETLVGTIDYEAVIPYWGEDGEWLEFQNMSVNGNKYLKGFNVKSQSNKELWSGCSGIGLERWASAFFVKEGVDPVKWPEGGSGSFEEAVVLVYAVAVYCMEYIVTTTNYLIHHLSFQLFP
jgi:hypothetical protein